jgi:hypothetical protein
MLKAGILLPCGTGKFPDPVFYDDYKDIQSSIGGLFTTLEWDEQLDDTRVAITGFARDEITPDETNMNWFAAAMFNQPIHGDVLIAWHLSPNGEKDGDVYDLPDFVSHFVMSDFSEGVVRCYAEATIMSHLFVAATNEGVITQDELRVVMDYMEFTTSGKFNAMTDSQKAEALQAIDKVDEYAKRRAEEMGAEGDNA